jgi:membrane-associated phospholipid phosphatase
VRQLDSNGPKGLFVAVALASGAALAALSVAVGTEGPIVGDGVVQFFDEHYYDLEVIRQATKAIVQLSIVLGIAFAVALLGLLLAARAYVRAAFWALAVGGAVVLTRVLKEAVERPEIGLRQAEFSFPSGNATVSVAGILALVLLLPPSRLRRWIAIAGATAIPLYGFALVLLLWHYPSDVVAGWALGLAWVSALWLVCADQR